jgi:hypothetical protein
MEEAGAGDGGFYCIVYNILILYSIFVGNK